MKADEYLLARATPEPNSGCWLWENFTDALGYGRTEMAGVPEHRAHRIAWHLTHGPVPRGLRVLHKCDVRCCVNPDHLFIGTQADNVADMVRKGRNRNNTPRGSANHYARLDEDSVWAIRQMLAHKLFTQAEIARDYGVSPMTLSRIANNQTWRHV